jgi:hypothetical protein
LEFLMNEQCDEVQGYLLATPDRIESFRDLTHGEAASGAASEATPVVVPFAPRTSFNG